MPGMQECIARFENEPGVDDAGALCAWMEANQTGFFGSDSSPAAVAAAVHAFQDRPGRRTVRGEIVIPNVEVFSAGEHRGQLYTLRDLDDMVQNFRRFSSGADPLVEPTAVIGHEEEQELLGNTGIPAVGRVVGLRRRGRKLFADVTQVFPQIADLVEAGAYSHVSPEIYPPEAPPEGVPARGCMLRRLAFLGGELPHIKTLADLPQPVRRFGERLTRHAPPRALAGCTGSHRDPKSRTWVLFFEVIKMADSDMKAAAVQAITAAFPGLPPDWVEKLPDDLLAELAAAAAGGPAGTEGAAAMQEVVWPEGMTRDDVVAALEAAGQSTEGLSDQDLLALYQQLSGGGAAPMAEGAIAPSPAPAPAPGGAAGRSPTKVTLNYAERRLRVLEARMKAAEARQRQTDLAARQRQAEEARGRVRAFCERMVREHRLTPAEAEFDQRTGRAVGPVAARLCRADAVRRFVELGNRTELDLQMAEVEARPARSYGEQMPDPLGRKGDGLAPRRREDLLRHYRTGRQILADEARRK